MNDIELKIRQTVNKQYYTFLQHLVDGDVNLLFPMYIPFTKIKSTEDWAVLNSWLTSLQSLTEKYGLILTTVEKKMNKFGKNDYPQSLSIDSKNVFIQFIGKEGEVDLFLKNLSIINAKLPQIKEWLKLKNNVKELFNTTNDWLIIIQICQYFLENPRPNIYLRQILIENMSTKFIETNSTILISLLDFLIPNDIKDTKATKFEKRYYLETEEPLLRIMFLDVKIRLLPELSNIGITLSEVNNVTINCKKVLIVENKTNFLMFNNLPELPETIIIWGKGFAVTELKKIKWLEQKELFYWGDLDAHGLQILNTFREYFPKAKSVMMDTPTFEQFKDGNVIQSVRSTAKQESLLRLDANEKLLFEYLNKHNYRLEQEKIDMKYVINVIKSIILD